MAAHAACGQTVHAVLEVFLSSGAHDLFVDVLFLLSALLVYYGVVVLEHCVRLKFFLTDFAGEHLWSSAEMKLLWLGRRRIMKSGQEPVPSGTNGSGGWQKAVDTSRINTLPGTGIDVKQRISEAVFEQHLFVAMASDIGMIPDHRAQLTSDGGTKLSTTFSA